MTEMYDNWFFIVDKKSSVVIELVVLAKRIV